VPKELLGLANLADWLCDLPNKSQLEDYLRWLSRDRAMTQRPP